MASELIADFEKRFSRQTRVAAAFRHPVDRFSVTVLFGPSGCGKTTILRCLAGLERPECGTIRFGEKPWFDHRQRLLLSPQQRRIGYLFQNDALFPHLRVAENIGYGLSRLGTDERRRRVAELLDLLGLQGLEDRFPHQVSGGQQQRIALARVLAVRPRLLLLDEPLSALDTSLRERLRRELRQLLSASETPSIIVTHDRTEAISLADQVLVLDEGTIRQTGPPDEVFSRPADLQVAQIVGVETVVSAEIKSVEQGLARLEINGQELLAVAPEGVATRVFACIRAEDVVLQKGEPGAVSVRNRFTGTIVSLIPEGPLVRVTLDCGFTLMALVTRPACDDLKLKTGEQVRALVKVPAIHLLPRS